MRLDYRKYIHNQPGAVKLSNEIRVTWSWLALCVHTAAQTCICNKAGQTRPLHRLYKRTWIRTCELTFRVQATLYFRQLCRQISLKCLQQMFSLMCTGFFFRCIFSPVYKQPTATILKVFIRARDRKPWCSKNPQLLPVQFQPPAVKNRKQLKHAPSQRVSLLKATLTSPLIRAAEVVAECEFSESNSFTCNRLVCNAYKQEETRCRQSRYSIKNKK